MSASSALLSVSRVGAFFAGAAWAANRLNQVETFTKERAHLRAERKAAGLPFEGRGGHLYNPEDYAEYLQYAPVHDPNNNQKWID